MSGEDFPTVTELPGNRATAEQLSMIYTRYHFAFEHCGGKDVLEVACGPGRGLGYLAKTARSVVGGDLAQELVDCANALYGGRIRVEKMDAQSLPFPADRFDVVILFEALYYLPQPTRFLSEARRVLRRGGLLLLCTPNREWGEFNPSPFSIRYYTAGELERLLRSAGYEPRILAGFPSSQVTVIRQGVAAARRLAVRFGLVPKTMKGKEIFKRIFYGRLSELGPEIDTAVPVERLSPVGPGPVFGQKVLYVVAERMPERVPGT